MARDRQLDLRAVGCAAPNMESSPNGLCALAHSRQPPVSFASSLKDLGVHSATIIANENAEAFNRVLELDFDACRAGVAKCIDQSFAADPVDFIPDDKVQRPKPTFHYDTKINFRLDREFLSNQGKCMLEIAIAAVR